VAQTRAERRRCTQVAPRALPRRHSTASQASSLPPFVLAPTSSPSDVPSLCGSRPRYGSRATLKARWHEDKDRSRRLVTVQERAASPSRSLLPSHHSSSRTQWPAPAPVYVYESSLLRLHEHELTSLASPTAERPMRLLLVLLVQEVRARTLSRVKVRSRSRSPFVSTSQS